MITHRGARVTGASVMPTARPHGNEPTIIYPVKHNAGVCLPHLIPRRRTGVPLPLRHDAVSTAAL